MNSERSMYRYPVVVGVFVTLGMLILVAAIFTLGGQRGSFVSSRLIHAEFTDIGGLKKGDNVWLNGVKVGMIRSISIRGKNKVIVTLRIDQAVDSLIRKDSRVRISSDGIMGNRIVVIFGGSESSPLISDADVIKADVYNDPQALFRTLGESSADLSKLASNIREISRKIMEGKGTLGRLVNDTVMAGNIVLTAESLRTAVERLEISAGRTGRFLNSLQHAADQLSTPGNLAYGILEDTALYANLFQSGVSLRDGIESLTIVAKSLEKPAKALGQSDGIAGTVLYDTTSAKHLRQTLFNLDSASRILELDLNALQQSIFLRSYFKRRDRKK